MSPELITNNLWLMYLIVGLFSLAIGSLLNVIIYRLPIMLDAEWKQQCCDLFLIENNKEKTNINLFFPLSFCPHCKASIKPWHNIPLLSYLLLKGRCKECKTPISIRYPLIELLTLLLSLYASWHFGFNIQLLFVLCAIWILIVLFFIDIDHHILPDSLTLGLLWLGLIANSQSLFIDLNTAVFSVIGAYLSLWLFIKIFYLITGKIGMGHGDFKLFAAFAAWYGWVLLPFTLILASIGGSIVGLMYVKINDKSLSTPIPFGPFLCVSGLICLFWGKTLLNWYLHFIYNF